MHIPTAVFTSSYSKRDKKILKFTLRHSFAFDANNIKMIAFNTLIGFAISGPLSIFLICTLPIKLRSLNRRKFENSRVNESTFSRKNLEILDSIQSKFLWITNFRTTEIGKYSVQKNEKSSWKMNLLKNPRGFWAIYKLSAEYQLDIAAWKILKGALHPQHVYIGSNSVP